MRALLDVLKSFAVGVGVLFAGAAIALSAYAINDVLGLHRLVLPPTLDKMIACVTIFALLVYLGYKVRRS